MTGYARGSAGAPTARDVAARLVAETLESGRPLSGRQEVALAVLDERDAALARQLVFGSLRWLRRIDHVLATVSSRPLAHVDPAIAAILRVAAFQLLYLDRVPPHAAVDEAVRAAKSKVRRAAGFVNAVLRRIAAAPRLDDWPLDLTDPTERLAVELSYPTFLVRRWLESFGAERARAMLEAGNRPKPQHLLAFTELGGRAALRDELERDGIDCVVSQISSLGLIVRRGNALRSRAFVEGRCYIQDEVSQAAALIPPPVADERVCDVACGPGGKSLALIAAEPRVRIVAADRSLPALGRLRANLRRMGRRLPTVASDLRRPAIDGCFARVVLDLPCSGTGTFRNHPELKWRLSESSIAASGERAVELMRAAVPLVEKGGVLVTITCSVEPEENELAVERLVASEPRLKRVEPSSDGLAGATLPSSSPLLWCVPPEDDHDGFTVNVIARR